MRFWLSGKRVPKLWHRERLSKFAETGDLANRMWVQQAQESPSHYGVVVGTSSVFLKTPETLVCGIEIPAGTLLRFFMQIVLKKLGILPPPKPDDHEAIRAASEANFKSTQQTIAGWLLPH